MEVEHYNDYENKNNQGVMMYICEECGKLSEPNTPQFKKIVETRKKEYHYVVTKTGRVIEDPDQTYRLNAPAGKGGAEKTTLGWEIVKEKKVCRDCYNK